MKNNYIYALKKAGKHSLTNKISTYKVINENWKYFFKYLYTVWRDRDILQGQALQAFHTMYFF